MLAIDGEIKVKDHLELISDKNITVTGNIIAKDGGTLGDGMIGSVTMQAKGETTLASGIDINNTGDKSVVEQETGYITIQTTSLQAANFDLRAKEDIYVGLQSDWALSGFIGGLDDYDPAQNVTLDIDGALTVSGGIVAAVYGMQVQTTSIATDGASVFIADDLSVEASNAVQMNTLVESISVSSTSNGDIAINEADSLFVKSVRANDGAIDIAAGGHIWARDVQNTASGDDIVIKAGQNLYIDRIETAAIQGAEKTAGNITLDAKGTIAELPAITYDDEGVAQNSDDNWKSFVNDLSGLPNLASGTLAYDNVDADAFAYEIELKEGDGSVSVKHLQSAQDIGADTQIEIRTTAEGSGYSVSRTSQTENNLAVSGGAGATADTSTTTAAGSNQAQISKISFNPSYTPVVGTSLTVEVDGTPVTVTVDGTSVENNWESLLNAFATALEETTAINSATVDLAATEISLTGALNSAFTLAEPSVIETLHSDISDDLVRNNSLTIEAGNEQAQVSTITFTDDTPLSNGCLYGQLW